MTSAAIARDDLAAGDQARGDRVVAILKRHPQYDQRWNSTVEATDISPQEAARRLFMLAARWPDDIRGDSDFDHPEDHFIDLPYKPPGLPSSAKVVQPTADHLATLKGSASQEDKAVALCWIFRLTGDVHQPLQTVCLFTTTHKPPEGDRGGTLFFIRPASGAKTISLHSYWDGLVLGSKRYQTVANTATELRPRAGHARADLAALAQRPFGPAAAGTLGRARRASRWPSRRATSMASSRAAPRARARCCRPAIPTRRRRRRTGAWWWPATGWPTCCGPACLSRSRAATFCRGADCRVA